MIDLSEIVIDDDLATTWQLVPYAGGQFQAGTEGVWVDNPTASPTDVFSNIQPSSTADVMKYLPEGERTNKSVTVYSPVAVSMGDGDTTKADLILWQGNTYRVQFSELWNQYGYWFAIATQCTPGT